LSSATATDHWGSSKRRIWVCCSAHPWMARPRRSRSKAILRKCAVRRASPPGRRQPPSDRPSPCLRHPRRSRTGGPILRAWSRRACPRPGALGPASRHPGWGDSWQRFDPFGDLWSSPAAGPRWTVRPSRGFSTARFHIVLAPPGLRSHQPCQYQAFVSE